MSFVLFVFFVFTEFRMMQQPAKNKITPWLLAALALFLLLILTIALLPSPNPAPWQPPTLSPLAETPTPVPGWWDEMPTPKSLYPTPEGG